MEEGTIPTLGDRDERESKSSCFVLPQRGMKVCFIKTILEVRLDTEVYNKAPYGPFLFPPGLCPRRLI
jgi:hypothetical protein